MALSPSVQVCWIYAREDESVARELLRLAAVLEAQGAIQSWPFVDIERAGALRDRLDEQRLRAADIVLFLCSPVLVDGPEAPGWRRAFELVARSGRVRIVPVLLSPVKLPPQLAGLTVLPRDGKPILGRQNRDESLLEVIRGLQEIAMFRSGAETSAGHGARSWAAELRARAGAERVGLKISDVFRRDGPPTVTFVEPPQFSHLKLELRTMGTGLIVEGPSKVGKSTATRKAMEELGVASDRQTWWYGQHPPPLDELQRELGALLRATRDEWLFIDDFHHLVDERYQRALASVMKVLADQPEPHAKITLLGINPLGSSLIQVMPDLGGRFRVLRLDVEKDWRGSTKIAELIVLGERAANLRFKRRDEFVVAAAGSFFLAQYLCYFAAVTAGVHAVPRELVEIELGPVDVVAAIQGELATRFRIPLLEFAAFDVSPPPRGAGLSLLWLLARNGDGFVPVREARLRFPMLAAAFDWLLESNITRCFQEHPRLRGLLYYNRATQTLTMEDPQLKFYLRELDWEDFAAASGHRDVRFHPEDGPLWQLTLTAEPGSYALQGGSAELTVRRRRQLLQLSDLHFTTKDQATVAYAQLAADLRQLGVERLDAVIVTGDLVERAEPAEYDAARLFLEHLLAGFSLTARQVALVPGNHDVSWRLSEKAYQLLRRKDYRGELEPGRFIPHDGEIVEVRDEAAYRERLQHFADLYRAIKGVEYPLAYEDQVTIDDLPELGLCILGLSSVWELDHHFRDRASIHPGALANALLALGPAAGDRLRIAAFHHPIHSGEDARIRDTAFLQQLAVHDFRIALHGHVHRAGNELYRYDRSEGGRRIEIIAAGTFGAPTRAWVPGYPLQYNLLLIDPDRITVETRCRREPNGAWEPDARWQQGAGRDPLPRYVIER